MILLNERSYEEQFSFSMTFLRLVGYVVALCVAVALLVVFLFMFTPIKQLVPGYVEDKWRKDATYSRKQVDSLMKVMAEKDRFIENLRVVLDGGVIQDSTLLPGTSSTGQEGISVPEYAISEQDSALRARIAQEDEYALGIGGNDPTGPTKILLFTPLQGMVSNPYNARDAHYGIDVVAPANSLIKAVLEGTVIFASWTSDAGYVIQIQHPHNFISVYKHNSVLLKKTGDSVIAGDAVAIIGDTGEHSDGPHLHFELWRNGMPEDPAQYFDFGE